MFSKEFVKEPLSLFVLVYLWKNSNSPVEFNYKEIEEELDISKYKQKKAIEFLVENGMLEVHRDFCRKNKNCLAEVNLENPHVRRVVENLKKQGELIPGVTKEDMTRPLDDNPVPIYPFKISGNKGKTIMDYGMQKYTKAFFGHIGWDKVTNRDLACVFALCGGNRHRDLFFFRLKRANWAGTVINKYFKDIDKKDFISVSLEFIKEYENKYMNGHGLNWNYIDKHKQHREELLTRAKENVTISLDTSLDSILWE